MLQSQHYGRARGLCKAIPDGVIRSDEGADAIVEALYRRDPLTVVSDVFQDFLSLVNTKRHHKESFKNFESRFQAQVSRLNAHGSEAKRSDALVAFALLANADVDNNQRVSVLANGAPSDSSLKATSTTHEYLKAVSYDAIASVLRQCDRMKNSADENQVKPLSGNSANYSRQRSTGQRKTKTSEEIARIKMKSKCFVCQKFGHWKSDHNEDGSLKRGVKALETPATGEVSSEGTLTFNMASPGSTNSSNVLVKSVLRPLLDDAAPYSGIGSTELNLIAEFVCPEWSGELEPIPEDVADRPHWQYGIGEHSSPSKKITGLVMFKARTDQGGIVQIRHLMIEGSPQWLVERNVANYCNILHIGENTLQLPPDENGNSQGSIMLVDHDMHTYIPHSVFAFHADGLTSANETTLFCTTAHVNRDMANKPWKDLKKIVDKVHKHVCGHSNYSDIKMLLVRNMLWNDHVDKYLQSILENCTACRTTAKPKDCRKVSLSVMYRSFNNLVCIDHMFLEQQCVMHVMDAASRYSVGAMVEDRSMWQAIFVFDAHWVTPFLIPDVVVYDSEFKNSIFINYLKDQGTCESVFKARRERGVIPKPLFQELVDAHQTLLAKRKLTLILRSKTFSETPNAVGDLVQVFIKKQHQKRGKWSENKPVLAYDFPNRTITVPGSSGRKICAVIEDVRPAIRDNELAAAVQEALDEMDRNLDEVVEDMVEVREDDDEQDSYQDDVGNHQEPDDELDCIATNLLNVGDQIEVYWPLDKSFYRGTVEDHDEQTGVYSVKYFDGDKEQLKLQDEV